MAVVSRLVKVCDTVFVPEFIPKVPPPPRVAAVAVVPVPSVSCMVVEVVTFAVARVLPSKSTVPPKICRPFAAVPVHVFAFASVSVPRPILLITPVPPPETMPGSVSAEHGGEQIAAGVRPGERQRARAGLSVKSDRPGPRETQRVGDVAVAVAQRAIPESHAEKPVRRRRRIHG